MWSFLAGFTSPKKFVYWTHRLSPWVSAVFLMTLAYGLIGGLWLAPADAIQGEGYRIIYVHVPCAFLSLFIYAVMAGAAVAGLVWRIKLAFLVIRHSAPMGAIFTFLALVTGSLWGKPMWGTWWIWDARLTSELILLFLYLGLILFQSAIAEKKSGNKGSAIFVLIGFIDIPIIHYSVNWWNTLHQGQTLNLLARSSIDPAMGYPLIGMMAAFLLYYAIVLSSKIRYDLAVMQANQHWLMGD